MRKLFLLIAMAMTTSGCDACPEGEHLAAMHALWGPLGLGSLAGQYTDRQAAERTLQQVPRYRQWAESLTDSCAKSNYLDWINYAEREAREGLDHPFDWHAFEEQWDADRKRENTQASAAARQMPKPPP